MRFTLTADAQAILLLTGVFGSKEPVAPLSLREYNEVAEWLLREKLSPADFFKPETVQALEQSLFPIDPARIARLLERGGAMAFALSKWERQGIWVLCRSDSAYPKSLKVHLGRHAPAFFYGVGNSALLSGGGIGVVGSRNVKDTGLRFTQNLGKACAIEHVQIVSGGARGTDENAMIACLLNGGTAVGVLADSLLRTAISPKYRDAVRENTVCLISSFHPEAGFTVGNAMSRNKYIYALADSTVVVAADYQKGGTWAGAEEELKRGSKAKPIFVYAPEDMPEGSRELLKRKTRPTVDSDLSNGIRAFLLAATPAVATTEVISGYAPSEPAPATMVFEAPAQRGLSEEAAKSVYDSVLPLLLAILDVPKTVKEMAEESEVLESQMKLWLDRAVTGGTLIKKTVKRKTVYQKTGQDLFSGRGASP